jgi:hypothetical protein
MNVILYRSFSLAAHFLLVALIRRQSSADSRDRSDEWRQSLVRCHPRQCSEVARKPPGSQVSIKIVRDGKDQTLTVQLGESPPQSPSQAQARESDEN